MNECDSCHMCASTQQVVRSTQILQHDHISILGRNACCIGTRLTTPCHYKLSHQAQELQPRIKTNKPALCWLNAQVTGAKPKHRVGGMRVKILTLKPNLTQHALRLKAQLGQHQQRQI